MGPLTPELLKRERNFPPTDLDRAADLAQSFVRQIGEAGGAVTRGQVAALYVIASKALVRGKALRPEPSRIIAL